VAELSALTIEHVARFDPTRYELEAYPKLGGAYASELELSDILRLSGSGSAFLEVGVGTGRVFHRLADQSALAVGLDPDARMVRHVANRMKSTGKSGPSNVNLLVADGEHLPFKESFFDVVVCIRVLRYFNQPKKAVGDMCRVLKPKGRLVLEFANILRPQTLFQIPQYLTRGEFYPRLFVRADVEEWVSSQGMQIEEVLGWHKVPVEVLGHANNQPFLHALIGIESILQRASPPQFLSRSLVLSATKT